ncbi:MAG: hypothetical protein H0U74_16640 [Bradymonadaceae bacterium]|nr:hypothetical protein [Lujinxingiaceae bacterium]
MKLYKSTFVLLLAAAALWSACAPQFTDTACEQDQDCFAFEVCRANVCVSAAVVDDVGHDAADNGDWLPNACGGTLDLFYAPDEPCGPCDLDEYVCDGVDAVVCDGATQCPALDIVTTLASAITATSATLNARVQELSDDLPTDHGLCWSTEADPAGDDCYSLGGVSAEGAFSHDVQNLTQGTEYFVRAFHVDTSGTVYANTTTFTTLAPVPANLTATQATHGAHVALSWDLAEGASSYVIYRDDALVESVTLTSFEDTEAAAGSLPAPMNAAASEGDFDEFVRVTWSAAAGLDGTAHDYTVVAVYPSTESAASAVAVGYRSGPTPTHYEISIDSDEWIDVGLVTSYDDIDAPLGFVTAGTATASAGTHSTHVALAVSDTSVLAGDSVEYRIRTAGQGLLSASSSATGHRMVGEVSFQWERATVDLDASYSALAGATSATFDDTTAPEDGGTRYYRVVVSADGAESATSGAVAGHRASASGVTTLAQSAVTTNTATLNASLSQLGNPAATNHGFCWSQLPEPALPGDATTSCHSLGAPTATGSFSHNITSLLAGTVYNVRAFATNSEGTAYGSQVSFVTVASAPTGVSATSDSATSVTVSWSASLGAASYNVLRGTEVIAAGVTATTHADDAATPGSTLPAPTLSASKGTSTAHVALSWTAPTASAGAEHTYYVQAVNASGTSASSGPATGRRAAAPVTAYKLKIGAADWITLGNVTAHDDTAAPKRVITPGSAQASQGTSTAFVTLSLSGVAGATHVDTSYQVLAVNTAGDGTASEIATGYRAIGALEYQWQRSATETNDTFSDIAGGITSPYEDVAAPANGDERFYRAVISAAGADDATSTPAAGYRAVLPVVTTWYVDDITPDAAKLVGDFVDLGKPEATAFGFCVSKSTLPSLTEATPNCQTAGSPALGEFELFFSNLDEETLYYARAYATNDHGTSYGDSISFDTDSGP